MFATADGVGIFKSTYYGVSFSATSALALHWQSIASDSSGLNLFAAASSGDGIYQSTDSGASWNAVSISAPSVNDWNSISCDGIGKYVYVVSGKEGYGGVIYMSSNYGTSWVFTRAPSGLYTKIVSA